MIVDLHGKAGHIRTVPIPLWAKEALDRWTEASGIKDSCLFRAISKSGKIWGQGMTPKVLWEIVKRAAEAAGIDTLAPHYVTAREAILRFRRGVFPSLAIRLLAFQV